MRKGMLITSLAMLAGYLWHASYLLPLDGQWDPARNLAGMLAFFLIGRQLERAIDQQSNRAVERNLAQGGAGHE